VLECNQCVRCHENGNCPGCQGYSHDPHSDPAFEHNVEDEIGWELRPREELVQFYGFAPDGTELFTIVKDG
jgi:hypothetical protein